MPAFVCPERAFGKCHDLLYSWAVSDNVLKSLHTPTCVYVCVALVRVCAYRVSQGVGKLGASFWSLAVSANSTVS